MSYYNFAPGTIFQAEILLILPSLFESLSFVAIVGVTFFCSDDLSTYDPY